MDLITYEKYFMDLFSDNLQLNEKEKFQRFLQIVLELQQMLATICIQKNFMIIEEEMQFLQKNLTEYITNNRQ
jgi:ribosome biogenesis protein Nip4